MHLYWIVDYEEETVTFEVRARISEHDWIGIGFRIEEKSKKLIYAFCGRTEKERIDS
ncbi:hypothetical protein TNCT_122141, partial [Trichonephila clavata]